MPAIVAFAFAFAAAPAGAQIVASGPDHYTLRHEAASALSPEEAWARLIDPSLWWHPDHTYSGDAANLTLDPIGGGAWAEDWAGGSVLHGTVISIIDGEQLRLDAPFGPLQAVGVKVAWTITIAPQASGGSVIAFDEIATGGSASGLDMMAPAVDAFKRQAIERLARD